MDCDSRVIIKQGNEEVRIRKTFLLIPSPSLCQTIKIHLIPRRVTDLILHPRTTETCSRDHKRPGEKVLHEALQVLRHRSRPVHHALRQPPDVWQASKPRLLVLQTAIFLRELVTAVDITASLDLARNMDEHSSHSMVSPTLSSGPFPLPFPSPLMSTKISGNVESEYLRLSPFLTLLRVGVEKEEEKVHDVNPHVYDYDSTPDVVYVLPLEWVPSDERKYQMVLSHPSIHVHSLFGSDERKKGREKETPEDPEPEINKKNCYVMFWFWAFIKTIPLKICIRFLLCFIIMFECTYVGHEIVTS